MLTWKETQKFMHCQQFCKNKLWKINKIYWEVTFFSQYLQRREPLWAKWPIFLCVIQITVDGHKGGKDGQTEAENRNQCYYCNQVCQNANTLRRHCRQAHGKDRCHVCTLCNKAFKRATHLKVRTCGKNNGIQWSKALNLSHWMLIHWYPSSYCLLFISRVEALLMKTWASCMNEYSVWSKINKSGLPVPTLFLVVSASSDRPLHTLALNNKTLTLRGALQPTQGDEHVRLSFLTQEKHTLHAAETLEHVNVGALSSGGRMWNMASRKLFVVTVIFQSRGPCALGFYFVL